MRTNKTERKQKLKESKGITLIALVITIIVLLILAGVAIATLTGDNGILNQANKAKNKTTETEAIERVQTEVAGSYGTDGTIDKEQLNKNLRNINGLTYNGSALSDSNKIDNLPATVTLNGYDIIISGSGSVSKKTTVSDAKTNGTVFGDNTTITDTYGNSVTIPKGFKIASDSATDVTGGIVIEDATYEGTKGSQFVWVPVGTVYTNVEKTESKIINLNRYTFASDGTPTPQGTNAINSCQELATSSYGNAVAKDIEKFKTSANNNHGYYMGRYEAGVTGYDSVVDSNSNSETNWTGYKGENTKLVCKSGQQVWNYVTQKKASELSRNMYTSSNFTSDLINSYAWDTAIVFIQEFSGDSDYSMQVGCDEAYREFSTLKETGKGTIDGSNADKRCNIYSMAGNAYEWSTETSSDSSYPCVSRGGYYNHSIHYTSYRNGRDTTTAYSNNSFRPLLYL